MDNKQRLKEWYEKNKEAQNAKKRERYLNDKEYADKAKARSKEWNAETSPEVKRLKNQEYRDRNKDRVRANGHNYRARKRKAFVEEVSFSVVLERDKGKCYLCQKRVKTELNKDGTRPTRYGTIDHVIPLNKGGLHCYANVRLACYVCNSAKSDHIPSEGFQIDLFAQPQMFVDKMFVSDEEKKAKKDARIKAYMKKYREEKKDQINEQRIKHRKENPDKYKDRRKVSYQRERALGIRYKKSVISPEKKKEYQQRYMDKKRDEVYAKKRLRRAENKANGIKERRPTKEADAAYSRAYRLRQKDKLQKEN